MIRFIVVYYMAAIKTSNCTMSGFEAGYKLTTEEIVDDGICCTVGIYEPM